MLRLKYDYVYQKWTVKYGEIYLNVYENGFLFNTRTHVTDLLKKHGHDVDFFGVIT